MGKVLTVKIKENFRGSNAQYRNKVNFEDFKQLALFFSDLESYGGNIVKAFREYLRQRGEVYPY
jgi:hypothetical protein